ncbi:MAG TPA: DUF4382 domain-containing protein [Gemmatimonadaceae bacterium]|nr:DUF4382 domain-containing protein [Gemmatimonadaceae bacterium]
MLSISRMLVVAAAALLVPLTGCGDATSPNAGRITVLLKDDPGDVLKAVVTISRIYLQGDDEATLGGDARVVLMDEPVTTDLLTLAEQTLTLVDGAVVPPGTYAQLRFVITGGYLEVEGENGTSTIYASSPDYEGLPPGVEADGALIMPSFAETGIKVTLPGGAAENAGDEWTVLVDFDVSQSFGHQAGLSGNWVMHPVILATEFASSGSLAR